MIVKFVIFSSLHKLSSIVMMLYFIMNLIYIYIYEINYMKNSGYMKIEM